MQMNQYELARCEATAALAADPENEFSRLILGEACMRLADYGAGREHAAELIRLAPQWGWGHWLLGWCWLMDRSRDGYPGGQATRLHHATKAAHEALSLDATQPAFFEVAAAAAMESGQNDAALTLIDRGLAIDPECQFLERLKGQVLNAIHNPKLAVQAFQASLRLAPEDAFSHRELARILFESGKFRQARDHIQEAMRLSPNDQEARHLMLRINQTQHWLLRSAIWLNQSTHWIRVLFPVWVFATVIAGLPIVIWDDQIGTPKWQSIPAYVAWFAVVLFPLETLVLPLLTNMLWVIIGRDAAQRSLTRQERWDRIAPGILVITVAPIIVVSVVLQSFILPAVYAMLVVLAVLQSAAAAHHSKLWKYFIMLATIAYLWASWVLLNQAIHSPDRLPELFNFHFFTLLGALALRIWAASSHQ